MHSARTGQAGRGLLCGVCRRATRTHTEIHVSGRRPGRQARAGALRRRVCPAGGHTLQTLYTERFSPDVQAGRRLCLMRCAAACPAGRNGRGDGAAESGHRGRLALRGHAGDGRRAVALTRNFYGESCRSCASRPDTLSALEAETCTSKLTGLVSARTDGRCWETAKKFLHIIPAPGKQKRWYNGGSLDANVTAEQLWELADGYLLFTPDDASLHRLRRVPGQAPESGRC